MRNKYVDVRNKYVDVRNKYVDVRNKYVDVRNKYVDGYTFYKKLQSILVNTSFKKEDTCFVIREILILMKLHVSQSIIS